MKIQIGTMDPGDVTLHLEIEAPLSEIKTKECHDKLIEEAREFHKRFFPAVIRSKPDEKPRP